MQDRAAGRAGLPLECIPIYSSNDCCSCGCAWESANQVIATRQGVQSYVYHLTSVQPTVVYQLQCQCGKLLQYDGLQDAILNLNNVDLFSHELLKWYVSNYMCHAAARIGSIAPYTDQVVMQAQHVSVEKWFNVDCNMAKPGAYLFYPSCSRSTVDGKNGEQASKVCHLAQHRCRIC